MSDAQYSWTPITVDDVVVGETYVRATHNSDSTNVREGLVRDREDEYLTLVLSDGTTATVDTDFRSLLRRNLVPPTASVTRPRVGDLFTRTFDGRPSDTRTHCEVTQVEDYGDRWHIGYDNGHMANGSTSGHGTFYLSPDGTCSGVRSSDRPGRYIPETPEPRWVPATSSNVQVGSRVKGAPYSIGGLVEAIVTSVEGVDVQARTDVVYEPSRNGRTMDQTANYFYLLSSLQVRVDEASTPATVTWHKIDFAQLKVGDNVRSSFTNSRGQVTRREGAVISLQPARVQIRDKNGETFRATSLRSFEISNRVPEAVKPLHERYPTIHHLRAAIFDVVRANRTSGDWCSEAHDFVSELDIANGVDETALREQAEQVKALVAKLQGETAGGRGITSSSLEAAFETLGIPRLPVTQHKMMTVSVVVPLDMTPDQVQSYMSNQHSNITVEQVEES